MSFNILVLPPNRSLISLLGYRPNYRPLACLHFVSLHLRLNLGLWSALNFFRMHTKTTMELHRNHMIYIFTTEPSCSLKTTKYLMANYIWPLRLVRKHLRPSTSVTCCECVALASDGKASLLNSWGLEGLFVEAWHWADLFACWWKICMRRPEMHLGIRRTLPLFSEQQI
jgi:hypothetical protein